MTRYHKALGILFVSVLGLWGCARGTETPSASSANGEKIKALEAKTIRLEDELRSILAAKEQLQSKFAEAEQTQALLHQEISRLQTVVKERDALRADLQARTLERDQIQSQYDGFRNNLKELIGQAETSLRNNKPVAGLVSRDKNGPAINGNSGN